MSTVGSTSDLCTRQSFRTPLLVRYPKEIKGGTKIGKLVQNLDFAPTLLDYAGVQIPEAMQGESFRKLVSGETGEWRDAVYYTYYEYPLGTHGKAPLWRGHRPLQAHPLLL